MSNFCKPMSFLRDKNWTKIFWEYALRILSGVVTLKIFQKFPSASLKLHFRSTMGNFGGANLDSFQFCPSFASEWVSPETMLSSKFFCIKFPWILSGVVRGFRMLLDTYFFPQNSLNTLLKHGLMCFVRPHKPANEHLTYASSHI